MLRWSLSSPRSSPCPPYRLRYLHDKFHHLLAPLLISSHPLRRPPLPFAHPWATLQVSRILWYPAITYEPRLIRLANLLNPLPLRSLVGHHIYQAFGRPRGPAQMRRCLGMYRVRLSIPQSSSPSLPLHRLRISLLVPLHARVPLHPHQCSWPCHHLCSQPFFDPRPRVAELQVPDAFYSSQTVWRHGVTLSP